MVSIPRDKNMNSTLDIAVIQTTCSPDGEANVDATVGQLCDGIRAGAPRAVAETKRILGHVPGLSRDEAFGEMQELSDRLFQGSDAAEGMAAFREKRPPRWA